MVEETDLGWDSLPGIKLLSVPRTWNKWQARADWSVLSVKETLCRTPTIWSCFIFYNCIGNVSWFDTPMGLDPALQQNASNSAVWASNDINPLQHKTIQHQLCSLPIDTLIQQQTGIQTPTTYSRSQYILHKPDKQYNQQSLTFNYFPKP